MISRQWSRHTQIRYSTEAVKDRMKVPLGYSDPNNTQVPGSTETVKDFQGYCPTIIKIQKKCKMKGILNRTPNAYTKRIINCFRPKHIQIHT